MEKSICFISRFAHYVLLNRTEEIIGGAEFQQTILARALCARGWKVSFITEKIDQQRPVIVDGIHLFPVIDYSAGNRYMRRILSVPCQLWKWMKANNSQLYYQRNPGPFSSVIAIYCRSAGKRFILSGANDANFDRKKELNVESYLDVLEIRYGIKFADKILLQNERQKFLLKTNYNREGIVFYNLYDPPALKKKTSTYVETFKTPRLLWVGRLARQKRPEMCLELAKLLPDFEIIMVGSRTGQVELAERIKKKVRSIENITFVGHLPLPEVEELFDSILGLVNTSFVEGFPNTFLQAWSRGLPVFSFVEPDNIISNNNLGAKVSSTEEMATSIRKKFKDRQIFLQDVSRIRSFFDDNFSVETKITELERILLSP
jgi:glycosyltransferase involved in cell wall biosynthesis